MKNIFYFFILSSVFVFFFFGTSIVAQASETNGTITVSPAYAWGENIGWMNFSADNSAVTVTDSGLTGYVWTANYGWINLSPGGDFGGVTNSSTGVLGGYAWSALLGPISFTGVTISSSGVFSGETTGSSAVAGRVTFNCANCSVTTDWRPVSARTTESTTEPSTSGGGGIFGILGQIVGVNQPATVIEPIIPVAETKIPKKVLDTTLDDAGITIKPETKEHINAFNEELVVDTDQSGTLVQNLKDGHIAVVEIPKGVADTESLEVSVVARSVSENPTNNASLSVRVVDKIVFDITAKDQKGNLVHSFVKPIRITLVVPENLRNTDNLGVYYLNEQSQEWIHISDAIFKDKSVSFYVNHLTRFAIFKTSKVYERIPVGIPASTRIRLSWFLVIIICIVVWYLHPNSRKHVE